MTDGLVIHVRANPVQGIRAGLRRIRLATEWRRRGGQAVIYSGPLPARLKWNLQKSGLPLVEMAPGSPTGMARQLWQLAGDSRCRTLVIDDSCPELVHQTALQKPSRSRLVLVGSTPPNNCEPEQVDFATNNRAAFAIVDESSEHLSSRKTRRLESRVLADLSRLDSKNGKRIASQLFDNLVRHNNSDNMILDFVAPAARTWFTDSNCTYEQLDRITLQPNLDRIIADQRSIRLALCSDPEEFFQLASAGVAGVFLASDGNQCPDLSSRTDITPLPTVIRCNENSCADEISRFATLVSDKSPLIGRQARQMHRLVDSQGALRLCEAIAGHQTGRRRQTA